MSGQDRVAVVVGIQRHDQGVGAEAVAREANALEQVAGVAPTGDYGTPYSLRMALSHRHHDE